MPYKDKRDLYEAQKRYRARKKVKVDKLTEDKDQLTKDFEKAIKNFEETIAENEQLKADNKRLKELARDPSLTDKEARALILTMPSHVSLPHHLKKLEKPRLELKKNE